MSNIGYVNVSLEASGCILSFVVAVCLLAGGRTRAALDRLFLRLLICNAAILFFDAAAWLFKGRPGRVNWWGVRVSNFLVFALGYVLLAAFTHYLTAYLGLRVRVSPSADSLFKRADDAMYQNKAAMKARPVQSAAPGEPAAR